jgi:hypothetical protein
MAGTVGLDLEGAFVVLERPVCQTEGVIAEVGLADQVVAPRSQFGQPGIVHEVFHHEVVSWLVDGVAFRSGRGRSILRW